MKRMLTLAQQQEADRLVRIPTPYKVIAERLGVTIGAVRDYFNSKEK